MEKERQTQNRSKGETTGVKEGHTQKGKTGRKYLRKTNGTDRGKSEQRGALC